MAFVDLFCSGIPVPRTTTICIGGFEATHGKGSHGRLFVGEHFTTVKRSEIQPGLLGAMLKQLNIRKEDF